MHKVVYSLEGNIGSGKTILLKLLQKHIPSIHVSSEPVSQWQQVGGHNLLQQYYNDPHRWSYTFQNYALLTRSNNLKLSVAENKTKENIIFSERSIVADREIFAKLLWKQNKMSSLEYNLYHKFYEDLQKVYELPIRHKHIYLKTNPEICLERIKKRSREEQKAIDMSYLKDLHGLHE